jgi:hypothetical protein
VTLAASVAALVPTVAAVPEKRTATGPGGAVVAAEIVTEREPPAVSVKAGGETDVPDGTDAVTSTLPPNPFMGVTVTVVEAVPPGGSETEAGVRESEKSGPDTIVSGRVVPRLPGTPGEVPEIDTVIVDAAAPAARTKERVWEEPGAIVNWTGWTVTFGTGATTTSTAAEKPFSGRIETTAVPVLPGVSVSAAGVTAREKSGADVIVTASEAVRVPVSPAAVPLNVTDVVPFGAPAAAVIVMDWVAPGKRVNEAGAKERFAAAGAETWIAPEKPLIPAADTVATADPPEGIETDAGLTAREKSGVRTTVTERVAVRVPEIPAAVPEKVAERVPAAAVGAAETVTVCEAPVGSEKLGGENEIPVRFGAVTVTVPENPFNPVAVTTAVAEWPGSSVSAPGDTPRETSGPETMCKATEAVRAPVTPAALPLKSSVTSPGETAGATASVTLCEVPGTMPKLAGVTVTPAGGEAVTVIVPANP